MSLAFFLLLAVASVSGSAENRRSRCERISIPMCQDVPYNLTRMPNLMGHKDQATAAIQVHEFIPLVEIGCSKHLKFFLCSLYAPMCTEQVDLPIPSCQSICEDVKAKCLPVLQQFNFNWPQMLNCSRLPVPQKNGLCMEFPNITEELRAKPEQESGETTTSVNVISGSRFFKNPLAPWPGLTFKGIPPAAETGKKDSANFKPCPDTYVAVEELGEQSCVPRCGSDVLFTRKDKVFAEVWLCVWAAVCAISTLFTVSTFCIDSVRFRYPERPIVFISMCYALISVSYLFRSFVGSEFVSCDSNRQEVDPHLIVEGLENLGCIVVFVVTYFFGMASSLWWVLLTLTWYLAAGKTWGHEAIKARASYFHLIAWAIPALLTIAVLTLRYVEADELFGLCYVGSQNRRALLLFVIVPFCLFFSVGAVFIVLGFVALFKIRRVMKHRGRNINKLENLMMRIGVFSILYTVPSLCVIGCYLFEYNTRAKWQNAAIITALECQLRNAGPCPLSQSIPSSELFLIKHFVSLLMGITTGVWVWSNKTWNSWGRFFTSRFRRKRRQIKALGINAKLQQTPLAWKQQGVQITTRTTRV